MFFKLIQAGKAGITVIMAAACGILLSQCRSTTTVGLPDMDWTTESGKPDFSWVKQVGAQQFPKNKIFTVSGAAGDGKTLCTVAIQKTLDECCKAGGGTVTLAPGTYLTGALFIGSGVNFRIDSGVTLVASPDSADYPEFRTRIAGIEMVWPAAILNILDARKVAVSGNGTLDCNGEKWWKKFWTMLPTYEKQGLRWAVDYDAKRVRGILISNSSDITLQDLTILRSGFWTVQILYSDRCTVNGLTINNNIGGHGPSTDGVDIDSSTRILIENCTIDCNDDNYVLKAGKDADGQRVNRPTEYVVIRNCTSLKGVGLITCGSETAGSIRNVLAYNLKAKGTSQLLQLKSALSRGGTVENIYVSDVQADGVGTLFSATLNWFPAYSYPKIPSTYDGKPVPEHWKAICQPVEPKEKGYPHFRHVYLSNVQATNTNKFASIAGWNDSLRVEYFGCRNITAEVKSAGTVKLSDNVRFIDVHLKTQDGKPLKSEDNTHFQNDIDY